MPDAPEDVVARWCSLCGGEIYAGESYYEPDGRAVCRDCGPGAFVETDGLLSNFQQLKRTILDPDWEDHIHFSRQSCDLLGQRYFDAYRKVAGR